MFGLSQSQKPTGETSSSRCPYCGRELPHEVVQPEEPQARISDLEGQVKILSGKAAAAGMIIARAT